MAYHLTADVVSRGKGDSMVDKAAYNSRTSITEERTGQVKDYSRHEDKPLRSYLFAADPELREPAKLWNFYDRHEKASNAQIGYSFIGSLPWQLDDEQRDNIIKDFGREQFLRKGVAAQVDMHRPDPQGDDRNFHAHILASMRKVTKDGLGERVFTWNDRKKNLANWREKWADRCARELEKAGFKVEAERWRYGYLPQEQQRQKALERGDLEWADIKAGEPGHHLGPKATAMERRKQPSDRGELNRTVARVNGLKRESQAIERAIRDEKEKLDAPPKTPQDALERGADMAEALSRGRRGRGKATDAAKRDGDRQRHRSPSRHRRSEYDAAAAYREYWRKHIWGEREHEHDTGGLER